MNLTKRSTEPQNVHAFDGLRAGYDSPNALGATAPSNLDSGVFLRPKSIYSMVGCAGTSKDVPVPKARSVNPAHSATQSFDSDRGGDLLRFRSHP